MPRSARPDDLYRLAVPFDPRLSPDGTHVAFTLKRAAVGKDAYRHSIWLVPVDGSTPARQVTLGARTDRHARFSPDGRTLAFLSDRRLFVEEEPDRPSDMKDRDDCVQVHLLPLDGGEARRLTDLPKGVSEFAWSPDGTQLAVLTSSLGATIKEDKRKRGRPDAPKPGDTPLSDYRFIDKLGYQHNGAGFIDDQETHLWLVDVATGEARQLVAGPSAEASPDWSPDGTRIAFTANRRRDPDIDLALVGVRGGRGLGRGHDRGRRQRRGVLRPDVDAGWHGRPGLRRPFPAGRLQDGHLAVRGRWVGRRRARRHGSHRPLPAEAGRGDEQRHHAGRGAATGRVCRRDGRSCSRRPVDGSFELWRVPLEGGEPVRLTSDRHYLAGWDAVAVGAGGPDDRRSFDSDDPSGGRDLRGPRRSRGCVAARRGGRPERGARRRAGPGRTGRAPLDERRLGDPGLAVPGRRREAAHGRRDPRRPAHALRLVADPGSGRSSRAPGCRRPGLQPPRFRGLRRGLQPREPRRLGRRADVRRHGRRGRRRSRTAWPILPAWA